VAVRRKAGRSDGLGWQEHEAGDGAVARVTIVDTFLSLVLVGCGLRKGRSLRCVIAGRATTQVEAGIGMPASTSISSNTPSDGVLPSLVALSAWFVVIVFGILGKSRVRLESENHGRWIR
jgi:hypothetical protein